MATRIPIQSTAGAVPIRTQKGLTMEKVKVTRYIAGKRPEYASRVDEYSSTSESDEVVGESPERKSASQSKSVAHRSTKFSTVFDGDAEANDDIDVGRHHRRRDVDVADSAATSSTTNDRRIRRLMNYAADDAERAGDSDDDASSRYARRMRRGDDEEGFKRRAESSDEADEDELSEDELERRRNFIRMRNAAREKEELLGKVEESADEEEFEEEESEYEESESDEDELHRLKPVFVKKKERVTLADNEKEQQKQREQELRKKFEAEERKRQSAKLVEDLVKLEVEMERKKQEDDHANLNSVVTDDENEELAYEAWKVRELKRVKRSKEEKEQHEKEKSEIEKVHNMTEDERRSYLRMNPKVVTNKQQKGKYKFLQKYYHRGVFYLDDDDEVYKRNFAEPTLDDHFDKTVLPKIMQVKDFGKAGRTKWSHLVSEDTTDFQSAWHADTAQNIKFFQKHGGGMKDVFERPALKKRKKI